MTAFTFKLQADGRTERLDLATPPSWFSHWDRLTSEPKSVPMQHWRYQKSGAMTAASWRLACCRMATMSILKWVQPFSQLPVWGDSSHQTGSGQRWWVPSDGISAGFGNGWRVEVNCTKCGLDPCGLEATGRLGELPADGDCIWWQILAPTVIAVLTASLVVSLTLELLLRMKKHSSSATAFILTLTASNCRQSVPLVFEILRTSGLSSDHWTVIEFVAWHRDPGSYSVHLASAVQAGWGYCYPRIPQLSIGVIAVD